MYTYDRVKTAENNSSLVKMEKDCRAALTSVKAALKTLKAAPKGSPGSVVPEAIKDLTTLQKSLDSIVGTGSPFIWDAIDV